MTRINIKQAINTGIVFGIVTDFLVLIGFNSTIAQLIGTFIPSRPGMNILFLPPPVFDWLLFLGLICLWAGWRSARKEIHRSLAIGTVSGAITGIVFGLFVAVLAALIGLANANQVELSKYLAAMIPVNIDLFLLGQSGQVAFNFYFLFITLTCILGALLVWVLHRPWIGAAEDRMRAAIQKSAFVQALQANRYARYAFIGLIVLIIFFLPIVLGQYWNYTVGTIGIYVLLGLGLNIVVGLAGLLDLGYVAFFAIGAYTMALLTAPAPLHLQWSFWAALPLGVLLASTAGILLGLPVLRLRGDYLAIVTLGFGEIIRILSNSDLLSSFTGGPGGVPAVAGPTIFGRPFSNDIDFVYLILLAVLLIIFVTNRLKDSRVGRSWISMREDETVARAMGINTMRAKLLAFAIGAAFAGLGGAIFASRNQFTGPGDHTLMVSINVLAVVIVGGMGSIPGVIAGAFVLKGLPEILREFDNYRVLFFGGLLVIMMIIRPEGLIPSRQRRLELEEKEQVEPAVSAPYDSGEVPEFTEAKGAGEG